jgi:hypothetical protein
LLVGVSRAVWFKLRQQDKVPRPVFITQGRPTWRVGDLIAWLDSLPADERYSSRGGLRPVKEEGGRDAS